MLATVEVIVAGTMRLLDRDGSLHEPEMAMRSRVQVAV
jgi:hypothetical protein